MVIIDHLVEVVQRGERFKGVEVVVRGTVMQDVNVILAHFLNEL